jgi:4-hydroxy-2-oxoheptanedioate aldolase
MLVQGVFWFQWLIFPYHELWELSTCIIVSQVSTAEKAKEIVADSRFPTVGRRGFGSPFTHAHWGVSASEYLTSANESILVMVQIETKEGVANVKAIAETAGIGPIALTLSRLLCRSQGIVTDVLFIGPYDLSICLGYPPPSPDPRPEVESVISDILQVTHNANKKWYVTITNLYQVILTGFHSAIYCTSGEQAAKRAAQGFDMVSGFLG